MASESESIINKCTENLDKINIYALISTSILNPIPIATVIKIFKFIKK